jgi:hypothetical protein
VDVLNKRLQNASGTALRQMRAERALELQGESILGIMTNVIHDKLTKHSAQKYLSSMSWCILSS